MMGNRSSAGRRLAIIVSHPIQYYSPWFRHLAAHSFRDLRVFYLWEGGVTRQLDPGFGIQVKWDVPLLEGYDHEFVPNVARLAGSSHWRGLDNPELPGRLALFQPDAILMFGYNFLTNYRLLFSRKRQPLVFRGDSHRLVPERGLKAALRQQWIKTVYRRFDAFLPVGHANDEYFRQHGVPADKLFFSPHSVDNDRFFSQREKALAEAAEWKKSLGIDSRHRVVLFAGKFEEKKRPRDLVAAFKLARLENTTLLLVGNGGQEADLRRDSAGHANIVFAPFQNQSQMPRTYAAGDVFVLPSVGGEETWGLAVNEAMCLGRPIIVSNHVGCGADLVSPRRNGLIFPAGDVPALSAALRETFSDAGRLKQWGMQSCEIIGRYDYARATEGLRAALDFACQRPGKPAPEMALM